MAADVHSREQRLRKQAELQSLYSNLANLREREASYIAANAAIPELLVNQINEQRQQIGEVETELLELDDETIQTRGRQFYREAFEAELAGDLDKALKLYKNAARSSHADANAAMRSVRYTIRTVRDKAKPGLLWSVKPIRPSRNRLLIGLAVVLVLILILIFVINGLFLSSSQQAIAGEPTAVTSPTPTPPDVILIVPETPTPFPSNTPTPTPVPADTPIPPTPTDEPLPATSPSPTPTLKPAPVILEPKDGLVWLDGAVVFEFKEMDLAYDELYCLNTLRGFDQTNTENWSYAPDGSKTPSIPVDAHIFRIAKLQEMQCIVWSGAIGKGSCDNIVSESTEERVIGLPRPCNFKR
jgi:hypothetical protein